MKILSRFRLPPSVLAAITALVVPLAASAEWSRPSGADACQAIISSLIDGEIAAHRTPRPDVGYPNRAGGLEANERPTDRGRDKDDAPREESARRSAAPATSAPEAKKAGAGPSSYSKTNTQEQAVDEGDIIKTDGRTIYHVSCNRGGDASGCRNELRIFSSWPATQTKLLSRYAVPGSAPVKQIYLQDGQVVMLMDAGHASRVLVLDVKNPQYPRTVRDVSMDGAFVESRMIGSKLFLATSSPAVRLPAALVQEVRGLLVMADEANVVPTAADVIARLDPRWSSFLRENPGLPRVIEANGTPRPAYTCSDLTASGAGNALFNLVQIDLRDTTSIAGAGLSGYNTASTVYASEGAFYVASAMGAGTRIDKLGLDNGKPKFAASGTVRGTLINQFAMSEHQGNLRVATSENWSSNNVFVMQPHGAQLDTIGKIENIAPNERIFAVRMMGDRGYVVTFRRTDPLYTLDLSSPTRPFIAGELKVEGWSSYLHPLGNNHLLAVGQDADGAGRSTGFHLQIFDVSDPRNPTRTFHQKLDAGSTSDAQGDHHAFMFEPSTMTLSMPWKSDNYFGLIAYRVDARQGFVDLGRVNHALMYKQYFQKQCAKVAARECDTPNYWYNFVSRPSISVDRVVAIDDQLYSVSPAGMMVHKAGDKLSLTASVLVAEPSWRAVASVPVATNGGRFAW